MRVVLFAGLLCVSAGALAGTRSANTMVRLGSKVITYGDTLQKVIATGVQPVKKTNLINAFGVKTGEEWMYVINNSRIYLVICGDELVCGLGEYTGD